MSAGLSACSLFLSNLANTHAIVCGFDRNPGLGFGLSYNSESGHQAGQVGCCISKVYGYGFTQVNLFCDQRLMITWFILLFQPFEAHYGAITSVIPLSAFDPQYCCRKTAACALAPAARPSRVPDARLCLPSGWRTSPNLAKASRWRISRR